jgi:2,4-dichlorophenol 6-monooxygenase
MSKADIEVPVLIVGAGPSGLALSLFLAKQGVAHLAVTKFQWTANSPRAHITNQRTIEIFRDMGIEADMLAASQSSSFMANNVWATSLAGQELGRLRSWGNHRDRRDDYAEGSPSPMANLPQHVMEPILLRHAIASGARVRFSTELIDFEQDEHGVTSTLVDRGTGKQFTVRSQYLVGADGGRSLVARKAGLPMSGEMGLAAAASIWFKADLAKYTAYRPGVLYWIMQPGNDYWVGSGTLINVRAWDEWVMVVMYDPAAGELEISPADAVDRIRAIVGDDMIQPDVQSISHWTINHVVADRYSQGRVFCAGDAVHRHPPANGLGSNTSIQDSYNLAWKLKLVLDGKASPALLETYTQERQPVGRAVVDRAMASVEAMACIPKALGFRPGQTSEEGWAQVERLTSDSPDGSAMRAEVAAAFALQSVQFNAHGMELGQRYRVGAVAADPCPEPAYDRDPELYYHATTWTGARLPHAWIQRGTDQVSTHDIAGKGRFTVLTGNGGAAWRAAAEAVGRTLGLEISVAAIGIGLDYEDPEARWASLREVEEGGCLLVRPDAHIGWRSIGMSSTPEADLEAALRGILRL